MTKPKTGSGDNKPKHEHNVAIRGAITAHTPIPEESQRKAEREEDAAAHKAERNEDRRREVKKMLLEGLALAAVMLYTGITTWQACLTRESLNTIREQFKRERRPLLKLSLRTIDPITGMAAPEGAGEADFVVGKQLDVNVIFTNVGKSIAYETKIHAHILFGKHLSLLKAESIDVDRTMHGDNVAPDGDSIVGTATSIINPYTRESGYIDASSIIPWDGSDFIVVFGRATYKDEDGQIYCIPYMEKRIAKNWMGLYSYGNTTLDSLCPIGKR